MRRGGIRYSAKGRQGVGTELVWEDASLACRGVKVRSATGSRGLPLACMMRKGCRDSEGQRKMRTSLNYWFEFRIRMGNKEYSSEHGQKEPHGRYIHSGIKALAETPQMEARS